MMKKHLIGLTGGIATGKTTVSDYLETKYHFPILDADLYARKAVAKNTPIYQQIVSRYGQTILLSDFNLDRQKLGEIIFNHTQEKLWLESLIHPWVRAILTEEIARLNHDYIVLSIPLLFEAKMTDLVTEIWVVVCDYERQIQRLMTRNKLSLSQAENRIKNQWSLEKKIAQADLVLDNNFTKEMLYQQIDQYLKL